MSTEIKSSAPGSALRMKVETDHGGGAYLTILCNDRFAAGMSVSRDDLRRMLGDECDAIVIPRSELPPVTRDDRGLLVVDGETFMGDGDNWPSRASLARTYALRDLALAEYIDAHPPVDEAQVAAFTEAIEGAADDDGVSLQECHPGALAHYLVKRGARIGDPK